MPNKKSVVLFLALALGAAGLTALGLFTLMDYSSGGAMPGERYFRAVHVLQSLDDNACRLEEEIPVRVTYADATESLLHHPDKILVLKHLADELAWMRRDRPKAGYYEACARLALGDRRNAVKLLSAFVIEHDYDAGHYALLCQALYDLEDYKSLLLMCREWQERDPACNADRVRFVWAAHYNMERYAEARKGIQEQGACLGWRGGVFDAKAVLAESGEHAAGRVLDSLLSQYPQHRMQILRLWNILKPAGRV